jgi:hypothetical protein
MLAYIAAQYCDVQLFHFWKRVTRGKHLWVRNNFSTLMSQMVDSIMVVTVTFGAAFLRGDIALQALLVLVGSNYLFKAAVALLDTGPFYLAVHYLRRYLPSAKVSTPPEGRRGAGRSATAGQFQRRAPGRGVENLPRQVLGDPLRRPVPRVGAPQHLLQSLADGIEMRGKVRAVSPAALVVHVDDAAGIDQEIRAVEDAAIHEQRCVVVTGSWLLAAPATMPARRARYWPR